MRKAEYFNNKQEPMIQNNISLTPPKFFPQERDWTCAFACARTILSGLLPEVPSEGALLEKCGAKPGPHFSADLKRMGVFKDLNVEYGCDHLEITLYELFSYMNQGYYLMVESMYNYGHWFVVLGYYATGESIEDHRIAVYDPYYNEIRLLNADEFNAMWCDGDSCVNQIKRDFIAVK